MTDAAEPAPAGGDEVEVAMTWRPDPDGGLAGHVEVRNVSGRTVRLPGKPGLTPLGEDGEPIGAETVVTLELKLPDHVDLAPGCTARASVGWAGWDGPPASGRVAVSWDGARVVVASDGPRQPTALGPAHNLYSSWFEIRSDGQDRVTTS